jgi:hypothetical protein
MKANSSEEKAILLGLRRCLRDFPLQEYQFKKKKGVSVVAHSKIVEYIENEWKRTKGFSKSNDCSCESRPKGGSGLDFIGRKCNKGRILLAMEVIEENSTIKAYYIF